MSNREKLRKIIDAVRDDPARRDLSRIIEREHSLARFEGFSAWDQARIVANELHAAGYRKPQILSTVEEIDALGRGSTVLDSAGDVWTHDGDPEDQWGSVTAKEDFGGPQWCGSSSIPLPATLIYSPEATA